MYYVRTCVCVSDDCVQRRPFLCKIRFSAAAVNIFGGRYGFFRRAP